MIELISNYWQFWALIMGAVGWSAKLELNNKTNSKDIQALSDRMQDQRKEDNQRHESMLREIRGDIKTLLHRGD